jgi:hypothetical protein
MTLTAWKLGTTIALKRVELNPRELSTAQRVDVLRTTSPGHRQMVVTAGK